MLLALLASGCWNDVAAHCRDCRIVSDRAPRPPALAMAPSTRAVVILVHGAFGFGDEWRAVVDSVRARPRVALVAFAWGGPWTRKPTLAAEALRRTVQGAVDDAPPGAEVLVIAHSAGGALTEYVGERLRVPPGRRVRIAAIASAHDVNVAPFTPEREVDTPLGLAVGGTQAPLGPMARGVDYVEYETADAPAQTAALRAGVHRVYLGARVGHNESVGLAALPLVRGL